MSIWYKIIMEICMGSLVALIIIIIIIIIIIMYGQQRRISTRVPGMHTQ